jgi:hypothetical protein
LDLGPRGKTLERLQDAKRRALAIADERGRENVALRAALLDAGRYEAMCPLPDGVTGKLRIELLERREERIARAAAFAALGRLQLGDMPVRGGRLIR